MAHIRVRVHSPVSSVKFQLHERLPMRRVLTLPFIITLLRNRWIVSQWIVGELDFVGDEGEGMRARGWNENELH